MAMSPKIGKGRAEQSAFYGEPAQLHDAEEADNQAPGDFFSAATIYSALESVLLRYRLRVESLGDFPLCVPVSALSFLTHIQDTSCSTI